MNLNEEFYKIVDTNCKEIPYEGLEINKTEISNSCENLSIDLMGGFLTFIFEKNIKFDKKGYFYNEKYYSRKELVLEFLKENERLCGYEYFFNN